MEIIGIVPLYPYWFQSFHRSESNADRKEFNNTNKELRRDLIDAVRSIDQEIKDFHGRLCTIEERRK